MDSLPRPESSHNARSPLTSHEQGNTHRLDHALIPLCKPVGHKMAEREAPVREARSKRHSVSLAPVRKPRVHKLIEREGSRPSVVRNDEVADDISSTMSVSLTLKYTINHAYKLPLPPHSCKLTLPYPSHKLTLPPHSCKLPLPPHSCKLTLPPHSCKLTLPYPLRKLTPYSVLSSHQFSLKEITGVREELGGLTFHQVRPVVVMEFKLPAELSKSSV